MLECKTSATVNQESSASHSARTHQWTAVLGIVAMATVWRQASLTRSACPFLTCVWNATVDLYIRTNILTGTPRIVNGERLTRYYLNQSCKYWISSLSHLYHWVIISDSNVLWRPKKPYVTTHIDIEKYQSGESLVLKYLRPMKNKDCNRKMNYSYAHHWLRVRLAPV